MTSGRARAAVLLRSLWTLRIVVALIAMLVLGTVVATTLLRDIRVNSDHSYYLLTADAVTDLDRVKSDGEAITRAMRSGPTADAPADLGSSRDPAGAGLYHHDLRMTLFRSYLGAGMLYRASAKFTGTRDAGPYRANPDAAIAREMFASFGLGTLAVSLMFVAGLLLVRSRVVVLATAGTVLVLGLIALAYILPFPDLPDPQASGHVSGFEAALRSLVNMQLEMTIFHFTPRSYVFLMGLLAFALRADRRFAFAYAALALAATFNAQMAGILLLVFVVLEIAFGGALDRGRSYLVAASAPFVTLALLLPGVQRLGAVAALLLLAALVLLRRRGVLPQIEPSDWAARSPVLAPLADAALMLAAIALGVVVAEQLGDGTIASQLGISVLAERLVASLQPAIYLSLFLAGGRGIAVLAQRRSGDTARLSLAWSAAALFAAGAVWLFAKSERYFTERGTLSPAEMVERARARMTEETRAWRTPFASEAGAANLVFDQNAYGHFYIPQLIDTRSGGTMLDETLEIVARRR